RNGASSTPEVISKTASSPRQYQQASQAATSQGGSKLHALQTLSRGFAALYALMLRHGPQNYDARSVWSARSMNKLGHNAAGNDSKPKIRPAPFATLASYA